MKKVLLTLLTFMVMFAVNAGKVTKLTALAQTNYRKGEVIVKFKNEAGVTLTSGNKAGARADKPLTDSKVVNDALQQLGISEICQLMPMIGNLNSSNKARGSINDKVPQKDLSQLYLLKYDESKGSVEEVVKALKQLSDVEYAEPNYIRKIFSTDYTQASHYSSQWYLPAIGMPTLWKQPVINEKRPVIAILDTGIDDDNPNIKPNLWVNEIGCDDNDDDSNGFVDDMNGWDFVQNRNNLFDDNGHGTHCAGLAAAVAVNNEGINGANPNALLMILKIMNEEGTGDDATIIKGVNYAIANGADILSMSFGSCAVSQALHDALENASQYAILVASAGNDKVCIDESPSFPAAYPFVIGVEATDEQGELATFSNYDVDGPLKSANANGYNYDVRAPGVNMLSTYPTFGALRGVGYKRMEGTSMACPLVAGAVSRLMQCRNFSSFEELRELLVKSSGNILDMAAAYAATIESQNAEDFQCEINGIMFTFHKTSESTAQVGNGTSAAIPKETSGSLAIPQMVHGLLVTAIGSNAFNGCSQIKDIVLHDNIKEIGSKAFSGCTQLGKISLFSGGAPNCADDAFDTETYTACEVEVPKECGGNYLAVTPWSNFGSNLNSLKYSEGDYFGIDIGDYYFSAQVTNAQKKQVMLYSSDTNIDENEVDGVVNVPEYIDGYQVTSLRSDLFHNKQWVKQVTLPNCITEIPHQAFSSCHHLETVNFPTSLNCIGSYAFRDCVSFKNGHVPGSVKTIEGSAFENSGIEELILDEGVERLDLNAFDHCLKLKRIKIPSTVCSIFESFEDLPVIESIEVTPGNPYYDSRDNCNAIISTKENYLIRGCKNTVIPDGISNIDGFWGSKGLTEFHLSKKVELFSGKSGLRGCEDLNSLSVDKYNIHYYSPAGSNAILEGGSIEALCCNSVIPEEATSINTLSLYRNSNLTSVIIPTAMDIKSLVFGGTPLTSVTSLAKRPTQISDGAFYDSYYSLYETDNLTEDAIYENATLYVPYGSKEIYMQTSGWSNFKNIEELPEVIRGDVNGDGTLNEVDYTALVDHLLGKVVTGYHPTAADADEDGRITARDLVSLKAILAGQSLENKDDGYFCTVLPIMMDIYPGERKRINVNVDNGYAETEALSVQIRLPEGMTFAEDAVTFNTWLDEGYIKEYSVDENLIRIVICPALNSERKDIDDRLFFKLNVNVADDIPKDGDFSCYYSYASHDGKVGEVRDGWMPISVNEPRTTHLSGDANNDGKVDSDDIDAIVYYILTGEEPENFIFNNADVNNDTKVNAIDIVHIVNKRKPAQ